MSASGLLAVLIGFAGDWNWFADLFAHLRPQYCLWLALAWFGSLLLRLRLSLVLATTGLVLSSIALAPHLSSSVELESSPQSGRSWTLATINLLQGNQQTARVERYLRETQPDIVVFQEVSARWAAALESLSDVYPFRFVQPSKDQFGLALFSREKPTAQSVRAVGDRASDLAIFGTWNSAGRRFSIAGIHPDKPDESWKVANRASYLGRIAEWADERAKNQEAVVVIGDFNATPWSASMRAFSRRTGLRNANDGKIFSATWNVWQPHRLLIDHAFFSQGWQLQECTIGPAIGSDHRPVSVRATLRE
jgi:endonuclease/exonuclease/phosphatase (EEP) superfamily protein YafD